MILIVTKGFCARKNESTSFVLMNELIRESVPIPQEYKAKERVRTDKGFRVIAIGEQREEEVDKEEIHFILVAFTSHDRATRGVDKAGGEKLTTNSKSTIPDPPARTKNE